MNERRPFVGGEFRATGKLQEVRAPWDGQVVARVHLATAELAEEALARAFAARLELARQSTAKRREVLTKTAAGIAQREEELARAISQEGGKPIRLARGEVKRAVETFTLAAAETVRPRGELQPIDLDAASEGYEAIVERVPAGVVVGIAPFNFPINLGAHKVAPALAVGAPILWKPPPQAPSAALVVAEILKASGAHPASVAVLPCENDVAEQLATDPRVRVLSFTGSTRVGWHLLGKSKARTVLELGGNAAAVVCEDADLDWAATRLASGAFGYAGQSCISVQRVLAQRPVYARLVERLVAATKATKYGDPSDETVTVGPVIDAKAADRITSWIDEAVRRGAKVLTGGGRKGNLLEPTVVEGVPADAKLAAEEVFGPVVLVDSFDAFDEALAKVNASAFGLQAGLFTRDLGRVREAFRVLEVGGLVVNDMPTFRSDAYPYGGMKGSGLGREGVRAAMDELTEPKVLVLGKM